MNGRSGGGADRGGPGESWWVPLEDDVIECLASAGTCSPAEIGARLGLSERAVCSVVSMLVAEGRIRIAALELPERSAA